MVTRDLNSNIHGAVSLDPHGHDSSADGSSVDLRGHDSATTMIVVGDVTDEGNVVKVQHADADDAGDPDTWEDVDDGDLSGGDNGVTVDNDAAQSVIERGYHGDRRFLRLTVDGSGNAELCGMVVRGHPHVR